MVKNQLSNDEILFLQEQILVWYERNQRRFPWRNTKNPYFILIAEKLLQQTSVGERVVLAYESIINYYPNIWSLANADNRKLEEIFIPLGLKYRANELIKLAINIRDKYFGEIPNNYDLLIQLPGIGEYSARAILSFAFSENVAVVDTNVARFLIRIYGIETKKLNNPARNKMLLVLANSLITKGKSKQFNYAVLDLTSAICKAIKPSCIQCPINPICHFRKN